jgi:membrane protease YdiL (CAAX protease family)
MPAWLTTLVVSVLFGIAHGQWNVGIDVFALSVSMCVLRELTGSIWAGALVHIIKNLIAFIGVFVLMS